MEVARLLAKFYDNLANPLVSPVVTLFLSNVRRSPASPAGSRRFRWNYLVLLLLRSSHRPSSSHNMHWTHITMPTSSGQSQLPISCPPHATVYIPHGVPGELPLTLPPRTHLNHSRTLPRSPPADEGWKTNGRVFTRSTKYQPTNVIRALRCCASLPRICMHGSLISVLLLKLSTPFWLALSVSLPFQPPHRQLTSMST